jgi:hypothetical protein
LFAFRSSVFVSFSFFVCSFGSLSQTQLANINGNCASDLMAASSLHHFPIPSLPILPSRMSFARTDRSTRTDGADSMLSILHRHLIQPA